MFSYEPWNEDDLRRFAGDFMNIIKQKDFILTDGEVTRKLCWLTDAYTGFKRNYLVALFKRKQTLYCYPPYFGKLCHTNTLLRKCS